jgi:hypothetical protein
MQKSGALDYAVPFISGKGPGGLAAGLTCANLGGSTVATRNSLRSGIFRSRNARVLPEFRQSTTRHHARAFRNFGTGTRTRARPCADDPDFAQQYARAKLRGELMKRAHERVFQGILN